MSFDISQHTIGPVMAVSDLDRARGFYEGVLGLQPTTTNEHLCTYPCGATTLAVYGAPDHVGNTATSAAWAVPDVGEARAALEQRGVAFEDYSDPANAFFRDPDGNVFVLVNA